MILELAVVRAKAKKYEERKKELEKQIPDLMIEQGVDSIRTQEGPLFSLSKTSVKMKAWPATAGEDSAEKEEAYLQLLREHGAEHLINDKPRVHNASLVAWVSERLRDGKPVPDGIGYSTSPAFSLRLNGWSPENV